MYWPVCYYAHVVEPGSVTLVWMLLLGTTGVVNIVSFPGIFRAFDPSRAVMREFPCTIMFL